MKENNEACGAELRFVAGTLNPADVGSKQLGLEVLQTRGYWCPDVLTRPGLLDLIPVELLGGQQIPKEYVRPALRIMATDVRLGGKFIKQILTYSKSFETTVALLTRILMWKYDTKAARDRARRFLISKARPSEAQLIGLKRQYQVSNVQGGFVAKTRGGSHGRIPIVK